MPNSFVPFVVLWCLMATVVLAMIVWRKMVASKEDDNIHMTDSGGIAQQQVALAQKLEQIDKWGKLLTIVTVVFGLVLGAAFVYFGWINGGKIVE